MIKPIPHEIRGFMVLPTYLLPTYPTLPYPIGLYPTYPLLVSEPDPFAILIRFDTIFGP